MLNTPKGTIYTFKKDGKMIKQAYDFIINNTNTDDKVCILPEGVIINFLTERTADNFFYNLIPLLYDDVFGENFVIDRFSSNPPTYFIILPIDNIEYGKRFFGHDYAQKLYKIIKNNYNLIENKNNIQIFKKKEV